MASEPSPGRPPTRPARLALETLPALAVALVLLPGIIGNGTWWPWQPAMVDLDVYIAAAQGLLAGTDLYAIRTPVDNLPFIYPPIAAVLMVPFAAVPLWLLQVSWAVATVLAQRVILRRAGVRRTSAVAVANVALVLAFEPFRTTLGYGQVNTLLMLLVVVDLLPDTDGPRRLPRGTLIGLAAAIKLTPLAFVVFAVLVGRRAVALWACASFAVLTALGALILPGESRTFLFKVLAGDLYGDPVYVGNQSVGAIFARLSWTGPSLLPLAVGGLAGLVAIWAAVLWWRRGKRVLAVGLVGTATCLASPLSWTHHHVWALLVGLAALSVGLSRGARILAVVWAGWVALCPVLVFLPYGGRVETTYSTGQQIVANLGPVLAVVLCCWLLVEAALDRGVPEDRSPMEVGETSASVN